MTVKENVMLPALNHPGEKTLPAILRTDEMREFEDSVSELADDMLERFGLIEKADNYASQLSGGERKLLEISRSMMLEPDLFLLDEPYAGVEEAMISNVADVLRDLNDDGITLIVIEHGLEALIELVERLVVLHEGQLLADGDPDEVVQKDEVIDIYLASSVE
jgi:branched-chain amino acid transport system ATP-binding protein